MLATALMKLANCDKVIVTDQWKPKQGNRNGHSTTGYATPSDRHINWGSGLNTTIYHDFLDMLLAISLSSLPIKALELDVHSDTPGLEPISQQPQSLHWPVNTSSFGCLRSLSIKLDIPADCWETDALWQARLITFIMSTSALEDLGLSLASNQARKRLERLGDVLRTANLRRLRFWEMTMTEEELMHFLNHHKHSLRELCLHRIDLTSGDWKSCFQRIRDELQLRKLEINELRENADRVSFKHADGNSVPDFETTNIPGGISELIENVKVGYDYDDVIFLHTIQAMLSL